MRIGIWRPYDLGCFESAHARALWLAAACGAWTGRRRPWPLAGAGAQGGKRAAIGVGFGRG
jgi:hypothetical protein